MCWFVVLVVTLVFWSTGMASTYVCGDATKLGYYAQAVDPSAIPLCPAPFTVAEVPEADIPAQTALYNTVIHRHLKVVGGLMVEMDAGEKNAVDAPLLAEQAHNAAMQDELMTQEYCSTKTLQQVTTKVTNKLNQINANIDRYNQFTDRERCGPCQFHDYHAAH